jgi:hypothetical protein
LRHNHPPRAHQILQEEHEDGGTHAIEVETQMPPHNQTSHSKRKRNQHNRHNRHREVADAVAEDEGEEAKQIVQDPRNRTLPLSSLYPRLYKKQHTEEEEVGVGVGGVVEEEVAQSVSHSVWLLVVVNLVGN